MDKSKRIINMPIGMKLYELIIVLVFIALCIFGASKYIISPIVSSMYFNPDDTTMGNMAMEDLKFDFIAEIGLTMPSMEVRHVLVLDKGYGRYQVLSRFRNTFTNEDIDMNFDIVRNGFEGDLSFLNKHKARFTFPPHDLNNIEDYLKNRMAKFESDLDELPKSSYVDASLLLSKTISTKELDKLNEKYNNKLDIYWVAVQTEEELSLSRVHSNDKSGGTAYTLLDETGFKPKFLRISYGDRPSEELYPEFFYGRYMSNHPRPHKYTATAMEEHFKSRLKYISKREAYFDLTRNGKVEVEQYTNILDYVEKNGVSIYKIYLRGNPDDIKEFINQEGILYWEFNDIKISKHSQQLRI